MDRKEVGATIARIDNVTTKPQQIWTVTCPAGAGQNFIGLTWAGDYVFASTSRDAKIYIFKAENGAHVGTLSPGPEVDRQSGWHDVRQSIRAHRRADGEYLIFAKEDAYAKVIMYRWRPSEK